MERYTLILLNKGFESHEIDMPDGYSDKEFTIITFLPEKNHQFERLTLFLDEYGFETDAYLLVEKNGKINYWLLNSGQAVWGYEHVKFQIEDEGNFRWRQIYGPKTIV